MTENPYRLVRDIRGIGFKTADAIAMKLGIEKTAMIRVRAGISYALTDAIDEGHCGLPTEELLPLAEKLLDLAGDQVPSCNSRSSAVRMSSCRRSAIIDGRHRSPRLCRQSAHAQAQAHRGRFRLDEDHRRSQKDKISRVEQGGWSSTLAAAAYNLIRLPKLICAA
jgi:ATP-dependent exoDNAse (exonuclease V) alpha subunit